MKQMAFGLLCILLIFRRTSTYSTICTNRLLELHGGIEPLMEPIFSSALSLYNNKRSFNGRNVAIKVKTYANQILNKKALFNVNSKSIPNLFIATGSNDVVADYELQFPMTASALVAIYNLPRHSSLTLSVGNMIGIYNGHIKSWNNIYIANNNPNASFPNETVKPIARLDNDISTAIFTQVLAANNEDWNNLYGGTFFDPGFVDGVCCNSTKWLPGVIHMYGNMTVGMVGIVASIPYSIGYATLPSLTQYTVNQASFNVKTGGEVINPSTVTVQAAMRFYLKNSDPNNLMLKLEAANDSNAYPLSAFTYLVLNRSYTGVDCCLVEEMIGFLDWYFFDWNEQNLEDLNFVPLIPELKQRIRQLVIEIVTCEGDRVYPKYLASKVLNQANVLPSWEIAIISVVIVLIIAVLCYGLYVYCRRKQSDESRWIINNKRIKIVETKHAGDDTMSDCRSVTITSFSMSQTIKSVAVTYFKNQMLTGEMDQRVVFLDKLNCKMAQNWTADSKRLMTRMKNLTHKNILSLIGVTVLSNEMYTIFERCSKGTIHYFLRTTPYNLTDDIKYQFAIDISQGMEYLHQSGIVHGFLNSLNCYLDSSWNVKVAQWEQMSLYKIENSKAVVDMASYFHDAYLNEKDLIKFLYVDPQILHSFNENVDVYSFGMLLIEIFTKMLPFMNEVEDSSTSYSDLLTKKFRRNCNIRPKLDHVPKNIVALNATCTSMENHRPNFKKIHSELKSSAKISSGIVDIIMNSLEQHAEKLEEIVEERTSELKQVTNRIRVLLHEVLPPQIADKLFNGEPVPPEYYECVTIYFSDIVGFTNISARSSPMDVMTMLNDLWIAFDAVIDKFNVYKVDTIGDAYTVCSGLPIRNGNAHCKEIALLALTLMDRCNHFKINHLPNESLKIRIGINSGPVTAGVVGSKMPQYCVFGDAVNTAARMESTSEVQRIQISSDTHQLMSENFPNFFHMELRGEIYIKGKGSMKTFWLLGTTY